MPTKDGFAPEHPLPRFLPSDPDEHEQRGSLRILKASVLITVATVGGISIALSLGSPAKIFADATASLTDISALQGGAKQSTATTQDAQAPQAIVDAQVSSPTARGAPARDDLAAAPEPAGQTQAENNELPPAVLLRQFQAWAAKDDIRAQVEHVQPVQEAPAPAADEDAPAPAQPMQASRKAKSAQNAWAEMRHVQKPRTRIQRGQNARPELRPGQDPRAPQQSAQNSQTPSLLQRLGLRQ